MLLIVGVDVLIDQLNARSQMFRLIPGVPEIMIGGRHQCAADEKNSNKCDGGVTCKPAARNDQFVKNINSHYWCLMIDTKEYQQWVPAANDASITMTRSIIAQR